MYKGAFIYAIYMWIFPFALAGLVGYRFNFNRIDSYRSLGTGFNSNFVLIGHAHFHCGSVPATYEFICKKRNISVKGNMPLLYVSLQHHR